MTRGNASKWHRWSRIQHLFRESFKECWSNTWIISNNINWLHLLIGYYSLIGYQLVYGIEWWLYHKWDKMELNRSKSDRTSESQHSRIWRKDGWRSFPSPLSGSRKPPPTLVCTPSLLGSILCFSSWVISLLLYSFLVIFSLLSCCFFPSSLPSLWFLPPFGHFFSPWFLFLKRQV